MKKKANTEKVNMDKMFVSKKLIGYIKNSDNTISTGFLDFNKMQMLFVTSGSIKKISEYGERYLLESGYGFPEVNVGLPEEELLNLAEDVSLDNKMLSEFDDLSETLSRDAFTTKSLKRAETQYNNFVHDIKHFKKQEQEQEM